VQRADIAPGFGLAGVNQPELRALDGLLELLAKHPTVSSVGEYFRDTPHRALFEEIEAAVMFREETQGGAEVARQEFEDGWRKLVRGIHLAEGRALDEKSRLAPLTAAEKTRYREIHQALAGSATAPSKGRL
jgi:hypothetical protein